MSDTGKNNRARAPNFTKEEQLLLCKIAEAYSSIIENKKTDGIKQAQKQEAWRKIEKIFNSNSKGVPRTLENLLACYRNMKSKIKKSHSNAKMVMQDPRKREALVNAIEENGKNWNAVSVEINEPAEICENEYLQMKKELKRKESQHKKIVMGTGGGPHFPEDNKNDPLLKLKKMIEPQVDGLYTIYDGDSQLMSQYQESVPDDERIKPIDYDLGFEISDIVEVDATPAAAIGETLNKEDENPFIIQTPLSLKNRVDLLRKKKATPLSSENEKQPKKETTNAAFTKLAESKSELVLLQKQILEKELLIKELELEDRIKENKHRDLVREKELLLLDFKINNLN